MCEYYPFEEFEKEEIIDIAIATIKESLSNKTRLVKIRWAEGGTSCNLERFQDNNWVSRTPAPTLENPLSIDYFSNTYLEDPDVPENKNQTFHYSPRKEKKWLKALSTLYLLAMMGLLLFSWLKD